MLRRKFLKGGGSLLLAAPAIILPSRRLFAQSPLSTLGAGIGKVASGASPIAFINGASAGYSGASSGCTTTGFDSSGGNFAAVFVCYYSGASPGALTVSDNKSNTYTALTLSNANNVAGILYYCANATCGSGHTFSLAGNNLYASISAAVFSNVKTSSPFDQEAGSTGGPTSSAATSSITPSADNELVIAGAGWGGTGTFSSINGGFSSGSTIGSSDGTRQGTCIAYLIQTTAAAAAPTFTLSDGQFWSTRNSSFKNT